ncbi:MAG: ATPase domain-containing protein [Candidatus Woesearchaeota archaeon]
MNKILRMNLERDELSEKLGGGIPEASLMLIEGNDGGGKSILAQRLTYGFIKNGTTVTYISSELHTMGFVDQMSSIGYDITESILHENLTFIPMFPYLGNVKLRDNFIDRLIKTKRLFQNEVIIVDTLSYLIVHDKTSKEKVFDIINFFKKMLSLGKTIIFCVDPQHLNDEFLNIVRAVADIYITVEAKEVLGSLLRVASIKRFRRSEKEIIIQFPFKVEPKVGLSIELASLS